MSTEGLSLPSSSTDRTSALLSQLDSGDIKSIEEVKAVIEENLHSSRDPGLLNALVEYYVQTHSPASLQILSSIHEARTQGLFEKMNECVKHGPSRLHTLTLLGHIVRRQPSWLYKIVKTTLFETLIKCLKGDTDILVLTSGILTITTLLPLVPASIGPWLRDLFDIYTRLCAFRSFRKGNAPEVYHLHLHVAVYLFFHRLYAMYPNNFLVYLRTIGGEPSKQSLFEGTIKPMLEHVRFHPCILTETTVTETEKHRWRKKEPHDIVTECMKVSLDPVDRMQEDGGFTTSSASRHSQHEILADKSINSALNMSGEGESPGPEAVRLKERRMSDSATQTGKSLQSGDSGTDSCSNPVISADEMTPGWSPSEVCGLSTPPSSQMSPATSNPDLVSSLTMYSHCSTPVAMYTPGQSPTASLGGDVACTQVSNLPSLLASKGKITGISRAHSGRWTSVHGGKAVSHEGQLTSAVYSVLAQNSHEEVLSAPAVLGVQHTSTPKGSENCDHKIQVISSEGHHSIENSAPTIQTSENAANISETQENGNSVALRTSGEHVDSSHCNKVSPKEEFRDSEEQLSNFAHENEDVKSLESHLSVLSSDRSTESVTPVGCQSPDSVSLPNTPVEFEEVSDYDFASSKDVKNDVVEHKAQCDSDSSLQYGEHEHQDPSPEKDHSFPSVVAGKTSVTAEDVLLDSTQMDGSGSFEQQNHRGFHSCDLFAPFLRTMQSDTGPASTGDELGVQATRCRPTLSQASPIEILDSYLKMGSSLHFSELARIPLVSQSGTDWTHFGGEPPVDEVEILRGQVQLLHNQLLFERHKCELHAVRNRRLIGKTFKAVQFQEELQATKDQLRLQEEKMRELTEALNKQAEDSRRSKEITSSWDHHQQTKLRNLVNENTQLCYAKEELQNILVAQEKDFDAKEMEVHQLQARVFVLENEMEKLKEELSEKHYLTGQVDHLVKELLIMGELNQSQKDTIKKLSSAEGQNPESNMQQQACHRELTAAKQAIKKQNTELEALAAKLADMESTLSNKDNEIKGLKTLTESLKGTYIGQIQSLEEKYVSQKRITQALESYILDLQSSLPTEQSTEKETEEPSV